MRILLLAPQPFFQNRGTPIAVRLLTEELADMGHRVDLLVFAEGEDIAIPHVRIIRVTPLPGLRDIRPGFSCKKLCCDVLMFFKAFQLMCRRKYDEIHAVEESVFIALVLKKIFAIPYVYDMDSSLSRQLADRYACLGRIAVLLEWFEKKAVRCSNGVVAVCQSLEDMARGFAPDKPILRLEDISLLQPASERCENIRKEYNISGKVIMYVGNLEPYQGIDLLLESFALIDGARVEASLVIIGGSAQDQRRYQEKTRALGIDDRVLFLGPRPVERLGDYLRQADILVSPRIHGNNTPMKIYSYLDSGRPLLATRLPTHTQVLNDSVAMLVAPEPGEFARGMVTLIVDAEKRNQLAAAAAELVEKEFSRSAFHRKLEQFYEQLEETLIYTRHCA